MKSSSPNSRRVFMLHAVVGATVLTAQSTAQAAAGNSTEAVKESEPYAKSMGFRLNTANVDQAKFPRHDITQKCSNCQLYSGKDGEPTGPCSFFKRMVAVDGWCRNFKIRKPAAA